MDHAEYLIANFIAFYSVYRADCRGPVRAPVFRASATANTQSTLIVERRAKPYAAADSRGFPHARTGSSAIDGGRTSAAGRAGGISQAFVS